MKKKESVTLAFSSNKVKRMFVNNVKLLANLFTFSSTQINNAGKIEEEFSVATFFEGKLVTFIFPIIL